MSKLHFDIAEAILAWKRALEALNAIGDWKNFAHLSVSSEEVAKHILKSDFKREGRRLVTVYDKDGKADLVEEPAFDPVTEMVLWAQGMKRMMPMAEWYHWAGPATEKNHWSEAQWLIEVDEDDPRHPKHKPGRKPKA